MLGTRFVIPLISHALGHCFRQPKVSPAPTHRRKRRWVGCKRHGPFVCAPAFGQGCSPVFRPPLSLCRMRLRSIQKESVSSTHERPHARQRRFGSESVTTQPPSIISPRCARRIAFSVGRPYTMRMISLAPHAGHSSMLDRPIHAQSLAMTATRLQTPTNRGQRFEVQQFGCNSMVC